MLGADVQGKMSEFQSTHSVTSQCIVEKLSSSVEKRP